MSAVIACILVDPAYHVVLEPCEYCMHRRSRLGNADASKLHAYRARRAFAAEGHWTARSCNRASDQQERRYTVAAATLCCSARTASASTTNNRLASKTACASCYKRIERALVARVVLAACPPMLLPIRSSAAMRSATILSGTRSWWTRLKRAGVSKGSIG